MSPEARRDFPVPVRVEVRRGSGQTRTEYAVNLSGGGLCLHAREALDEGEELDLGLELPPDGPRLEARGRVVWVSRHTATDTAPRFWEVGVRFLEVATAHRERIEGWARQPIDRRR
ncbi:MAG: PilZ domain-containing protein [Myxococcota bacterium]|nr:PilZ domain-containing protein [Myxococcota bacterium]